MTLSDDRCVLYPSMNLVEVTAVDAAYELVVAALHVRGFRTAADDRGENLVGAIARFLEDSKR